MHSQRAWRIAAPFLITAAAFIAAVLVEILGTLLLGRFAFWLMRHEALDTAVALAQFGSFAIASAGGVYAVERFLLTREGDTDFGSTHLRHCGLLYLVLAFAVISHIRCTNYCEGLVLGSIKFFALFSFGGILADAWALRQQHAKLAAA